MDNNELLNAYLPLDVTVTAYVYPDGDIAITNWQGEFTLDLCNQLHSQFTGEISAASEPQIRTCHVYGMVGEKHGKTIVADYFEYDEIAVAPAPSGDLVFEDNMDDELERLR